MSTRYSRPVRPVEGVYAPLWHVLPALLLAAGMGLVLLLGDVPNAPAFRAGSTMGLPSLPPAA